MVSQRRNMRTGMLYNGHSSCIAFLDGVSLLENGVVLKPVADTGEACSLARSRYALLDWQGPK